MVDVITVGKVECGVRSGGGYGSRRGVGKGGGRGGGRKGERHFGGLEGMEDCMLQRWRVWRGKDEEEESGGVGLEYTAWKIVCWQWWNICIGGALWYL